MPASQFCVIYYSLNKCQILFKVPNEQLSRLRWIPVEYPRHQVTNFWMLTHWLVIYLVIVS